MFNGIIYNKGIVKKIDIKSKSYIIKIFSKMKISKSEVGSSISCNGVCLTLIKIINQNIYFYLSKETISRSNFKNMKIGSVVNLEKSIKFGDKISGHYVQGHVDTTGKIKKITIIDKTWFVDIYLPMKFKKFIQEKASIAVNGVSLTISKLTKSGFQITIIPHSLKLTNLINLKKGSLINIEVDIFNKYIFKLNK
ncbi:MAG: riboflavin synthase [Pelagibacteraceae bacterium]